MVSIGRPLARELWRHTGARNECSNEALRQSRCGYPRRRHESGLDDGVCAQAPMRLVSSTRGLEDAFSAPPRPSPSTRRPRTRRTTRGSTRAVIRPCSAGRAHRGFVRKPCPRLFVSPSWLLVSGDRHYDCSSFPACIAPLTVRAPWRTQRRMGHGSWLRRCRDVDPGRSTCCPQLHELGHR